MASAQVLQLAHPPLWSMDQWPKFASCAFGRGAKGGCPFKKLFTQQLDVPVCEKQPREEGTEGHTLQRAGRGKENRRGKSVSVTSPALFNRPGAFHWGGSVPAASLRQSCSCSVRHAKPTDAEPGC